MSCSIVVMAGPSAVATITSDCHTLSYSIQCSSEVNKVPAASQLVVATFKMVKFKDEWTELVTGKNYIPPRDKNLTKPYRT